MKDPKTAAPEDVREDRPAATLAAATSRGRRAGERTGPVPGADARHETARTEIRDILGSFSEQTGAVFS